ncbi:class D sortase [Clostridium cylindrosporum]|uniref:Sortase Srta n=1 Tax=Clostridium cylindrosporum DSM 605 TaxID=1121307 RepID=A0A0J8DC29_CLOCY|nr:class D sortase [Clostridium cylindrosporum]KMT21859.1 sortase Srta [Clostridium cylindrosporum DSM 605]
MKRLKLFSLILISIGIIMISYAILAKLWSLNKQNHLTKYYEKQIENHQKHPNKTSSGVDKYKSGTIGILIINKIDLKVTIGEGTDSSTLKYAIGHFKDTAMPGEKGNFCVAGHRNYTYGEYFNRLDELEVGDEIIVKTTNGTYKYIVYNKKIVLPEQVEVLNSTKNATMTLITCTPVRVATHRLIINAKLSPN